MDIRGAHKYNFLYKVLKSLYYTVITDNEGEIILLSTNYEELLGLKDEDYVRKPISDIIPNSEIPHVLESKKEDIGHLFTLKNGKTVVCNRIPIIDNGEFLGVISSATFYKLDEVSILNQQIKKLQEENLNYKKQITKLSSSFNKESPLNKIIGDSLAIKTIKETIQRFAESDLTFLITGDTGTGKEVFANAIHELSKRRNKNFVKINCAAIPKGSGQLNIEHFDFLLSRMYKNSDIKKSNTDGNSLYDVTSEVEKEKIIRALVKTNGNKSAAAKLLKIDRSSLYNKIQKYNIDN